ncbi:hypothetical protein TNCV_3241791 [Trichonephila clavipes]|nr:hypothetical protein TNCV_3241791 [Trichonephila clavipes]
MLRPIQRIYPLEIRSNENLQRGMEESIPTVSETLSPDEAGRRTVLLARWIVRSVPLDIVESSGHEKVPTLGKPGPERPGRPRGERIEGSCKANLKPKRPFRVLPLTPEHRQLRLQWCQARSMWNVTDLQKVVFSDESRFVLGTDDNSVRVWRRPGERYNSPHTVLRHTARTAGVMVWGP